MLTGVIEGGKVLLHMYICLSVINLCSCNNSFFMARSAIPMIAFHWIESIYIYMNVLYPIYIYPSGEFVQLMEVACNTKHARALQTIRKKAACSFTSLCRNWN